MPTLTQVSPSTTIVATPVFNVPMTAIRISEADLIAKLSEIRGYEPITFIAKTEPKMRKTGNPFLIRGIVKVAKVNGGLNFNYVANVEKALEKEGKDKSDFQQGESWHEAVVRKDGTLTPFCRHKTNGSLYLRFRLIGSIESEYRWADTDVALSDAEVAFLKPFIVVSNYSNQNLSDPVKFLTYGFSSIKVLTLEKQVYVIS